MASTSSHDDSYYSILGLPKRATQEEIKRAYRSLSQVYHPDKQQGSGREQHASQIFTKILEAYEVLSDPAKREVYDTYGKDGLHATQLDPHLSREELRAWQQSHMQGSADTNYQAAYNIVVDARDSVHYLPAEHTYQLDPPIISSMSINSLVATSLSIRDSGWVGGELRVANGGGDGGFVCGYKRVLTAFDEITTTATIGLKTALEISSKRDIGMFDKATLGMVWSPSNGLGVSGAWQRQLSPALRAIWSCNLMANGFGTMGMGVMYAVRCLRAGVDAMISTAGILTSANASWTTRAHHKAHASVGFSILDLATTISGGGRLQLTPTLSCGMTSTVAQPGVIVKIRVKRGTQVFEMPVLLSSQPNSTLAALALAVPAALVLSVKTLAYDPITGWMQRRRAAKVAHQRASELWQARQEALVAQELLLPAALRSARSQQQSKGLVVLCATYGSHPPDADYVPSYQPSTPRAADEAPSQPPPPLLDVTVPLQYAVNNGQLAVPSGVRLMHRMGFFDPCPEAQKSLDVQYMFRGQLYRASAQDGAGLQLPEDGEVVQDTFRLAQLLAAIPGTS